MIRLASAAQLLLLPCIAAGEGWGFASGYRVSRAARRGQRGHHRGSAGIAGRGSRCAGRGGRLLEWPTFNRVSAFHFFISRPHAFLKLFKRSTFDISLISLVVSSVSQRQKPAPTSHLHHRTMTIATHIAGGLRAEGRKTGDRANGRTGRAGKAARRTRRDDGTTAYGERCNQATRTQRCGGAAAGSASLASMAAYRRAEWREWTERGSNEVGKAAPA